MPDHCRVHQANRFVVARSPGCETHLPSFLNTCRNVPAFGRDSPQFAEESFTLRRSIGPDGYRRNGNSAVRARNGRRGRIIEARLKIKRMKDSGITPLKPT